MRDFLFPALAAALLGALPSLAEAQLVTRAQPVTPVEGGPSGSFGAPAYTPSEPNVAIDPNRRIQQGDQLVVRIEQDHDGNLPVVVSQSGEVLVEPLAPVRVAGMTVGQAQGELKRLLEKDYYYNATVRLTLASANRQATLGNVYLSGYVKREGAVPMYAEKPLTISQAILAASGFKEYADDRKVKVTRPGRNGGAPQVFIIDVKEILKNGKLEDDITLQDGDRINVPEVFIRR